MINNLFNEKKRRNSKWHDVAFNTLYWTPTPTDNECNADLCLGL